MNVLHATFTSCQACGCATSSRGLVVDRATGITRLTKPVCARCWIVWELRADRRELARARIRLVRGGAQ